MIAAQIAAAIGAAHVLTGADIGEHYRIDIGRKFSAHPVCLAKPGSVEEVSAVLQLAHAAAIAVTVVGGQTGTCGAAVPNDGGIALSLERMKFVGEIDLLSMTMEVEAGAILQVAQEAAEAKGALLPLDLGSRGSATIGGVIATNAGGNRVLRWGMMRDMVLGLEAVLADGTILPCFPRGKKSEIACGDCVSIQQTAAECAESKESNSPSSSGERMVWKSPVFRSSSVSVSNI